MLSRSEAGSRREIDCVDGFKFGKRAGSAWDQSTYWVESRPSQKRRSSASVLNLGMGFRLFFIDHSFFTMHISEITRIFFPGALIVNVMCSNRPASVFPSAWNRTSSRLCLNIFNHEQWRAEKHFFSLRVIRAMRGVSTWFRTEADNRDCSRKWTRRSSSSPGAARTIA